MKIKNWLIGSDIEWFIKNEKGEVVSAEGLIKGTKSEPFCFNPANKGFSTSLDNVLYEGNIPPTNNKQEFIDNIDYLKNYMNSSLPNGYSIYESACENLDKKYITEQAKVSG